MDNHNYPLGADNPKAPWNQPDFEEKEINVFVSITLSKSIKIKVSDYDITDSGIDEDGHYYEVIDYSNCDLISAVREQITLPHEAGNLMQEIDNDPIDISEKMSHMIEDLSDWEEDDIEVLIEY